MAIVDVYEALRSVRAYKEAFSHEVSLNIICEESGKQFDPETIRCFNILNEKFNNIWIKNKVFEDLKCKEKNIK